MEVFEILRPDAQHHRDDIDGKFGAIVEIEVGAPLCLEAFNQMVEARPDEAAPYVQAVPGEGGLDKRPELAMPRIVRPHQRHVAKDLFGHLSDAGVGKADIVLEDLLGHRIAYRDEARARKRTRLNPSPSTPTSMP